MRATHGPVLVHLDVQHSNGHGRLQNFHAAPLSRGNILKR
jgi:hypothetical protein